MKKKGKNISARSKAVSLLLLALLGSIFVGCTTETDKQKSIPPENLTIIDGGKIGLELPDDTSGSAALTNVLSTANNGVTIYAVKIGEGKESSFVFDVKKIKIPEPVDIEYAFVEYALKYRKNLITNSSVMFDFGIYDVKGKRLRFKKVAANEGKIVKSIYYFMKNDYDNCYYELTLAAHTKDEENADSIIAKIAESVWMRE